MLLHFYLADTVSRIFKNINVLTPGTDRLNNTLEGIKVVPEDNCSGNFERIEVYNRWGKQVFKSQVRNFVWDPADLPAGVYYYLLVFSDTTKTNYIEVLK